MKIRLAKKIVKQILKDRGFWAERSEKLGIIHGFYAMYLILEKERHPSMNTNGVDLDHRITKAISLTSKKKKL